MIEHMAQRKRRCVHCKLWSFNHGPEGKCLFEPTTYQSMTDDEYNHWLGSQDDDR